MLPATRLAKKSMPACGGKHLKSLESFATNKIYAGEQQRLQIADRLNLERRKLAETQDPAYTEALKGTPGADPAVV
ncbi:MAG: hypothetical protein VCA55_09525 [Verrucomicrobiales bacterium]